MLACGGGGGGGTSATTNIQGNVSSASQRGQFEGISVTVQQNPSFTSTTDSSGGFEIVGIPSGQIVTLVFSADGQSARLEVDTPANTTVILQNINLNPTSGVATASQTVVSSSSASSNSSSSSSSSDDDSSSSDDDSSDDSSDDDSSDDDDSSSSSSDDDDDDNDDD